jgi:hypothetical protein
MWRIMSSILESFTNILDIDNEKEDIEHDGNDLFWFYGIKSLMKNLAYYIRTMSTRQE